MIDEEAIFAALFARIPGVRWTRSTDPQPDTRRFVTTSRRVRMFSDVPSQQQPACFQAEWGSLEGQVTGMPYKTVLEANWIIFQDLSSKSATAVGATENNLIIGGCRKALEPLPADPGFPDRRNTLGGLVYHCFITGRIFKDPGDLDGQGMIVIPIKVLVP